MPASRLSIAIAIIILVSLFMSCSGGKVTVIPDGYGDIDDSLIALGLQDEGSAIESLGLMGAFNLKVDRDSMSASLVPKRHASALGDSFLVSGISFFTMVPCTDCLKVKGVRLGSDGDAVLLFDIRHPFNKGSTLYPPSATNRLDLDIFDVALLVKPIGVSPISSGLGQVYYGNCANPDGYSKELELLISTGAALPYYLVIDDSVIGTTTFNKFSMGGKAGFEVAFGFPGHSMDFDLYLTMGYGVSAQGKSQRLNPLYFNPEFNRKSAWKVVATPPQGDDPPSIGNTWKDNESNKTYNVKVEVYDWQEGSTHIVNPPKNSTDIAFASDVQSVSVSIPGMNNSLPTVTTASGGHGSPAEPLIFNVPIANENLLPAGEYVSIVKVQDERVPPAQVGSRDFLIDSPDGIQLRNYILPEFATYQTFIATVAIGCGPITGQITSPTCPVNNVMNASTVSFVVTATSANGGNPIVLYEADWNYIGTTFTPDASNTTGIFPNGGPFTVASPCSSHIPQTFTVAFRATDSCAKANRTVFATCRVTVNACCTYQELNYNWAGCTSRTTTCQGWTAGGCGLPNTDSYPYGRFAWGCNAGSPCGFTYPYLHSGDSRIICMLTYTGANADYNVVSPTINLPPSEDSMIEWDHCNAFATGATAVLYISTNGCSGPWTILWTNTTQNGCFNNSSASLKLYSGSNVLFRFRYYGGSGRTDGGSCGNSGILIDDVRIYGCFAGTLHN